MKAGHQAGFTLIEVLVALVIVALGMGAVLSALTSAADTTIRLREKSFATWVALNQLATTRLRPGDPALGKTEDDVDFANSRWHWQQEVKDWQIPGIRIITIKVRYADQNADGGRSTGPTRSAGNDWLTTMTGFRGNALRSFQGTLPSWP